REATWSGGKGNEGLGGVLRTLELYCGIGGVAAALDGAAAVVAAVDINRGALAVYRRNFVHPALARTIEGLSAEELAGFRADLWWLSPPCQPFTRRGLGRDDDDPRAASLLALLERIAELGSEAPRYLALENVPGFQGSRCHARLAATLRRAGFRWREGCLCPTELGVPNRRRRYYLVASRNGEPADWSPEAPKAPRRGTLRPYLDPEPDPAPDAGPERRLDPALAWDPELVRRYRHALDVVRADEPGAVTACFTAAYGRSPVRSGSYLALNGDPVDSPGEPRLRRFSPAEVLRLLGFPGTFRRPPDLPPEKAWPLVGNSLSVPAVRRVLSAVPELAGLTRADRAPT
ncbi:MAG TPA: DNA cytosine methyltransferase, partial [Thermoanaerobaculia bacterium]|nr:DNA cytosine methyltransferase [Thermoanaerobaculia bacterium]